MLRCLNRNSRNNLWRDTRSIPNDPTGCRFLLSLKFRQDGQDRDKGWVWEGNAQADTQEKLLTDEEIKEIKEEVDEKESSDLLVAMLKKTIDTIMVEEF